MAAAAMKQRARRLVVSRSIERKPSPGGGFPFVPMHRYVASRRARMPGIRKAFPRGRLITCEIGQIDRFNIVTTT